MFEKGFIKIKPVWIMTIIVAGEGRTMAMARPLAAENLTLKQLIDEIAGAEDQVDGGRGR